MTRCARPRRRRRNPRPAKGRRFLAPASPAAWARRRAESASGGPRQWQDRGPGRRPGRWRPRRASLRRARGASAAGWLPAAARLGEDCGGDQRQRPRPAQAESEDEVGDPESENLLLRGVPVGEGRKRQRGGFDDPAGIEGGRLAGELPPQSQQPCCRAGVVAFGEVQVAQSRFVGAQPQDFGASGGAVQGQPPAQRPGAGRVAAEKNVEESACR